MSAFGFGTVYTSMTRTATHGFNAVGNLASGADALSQNAERNAWMALAKSSKDLCEELGIRGVDGALTPAEAIAASDSIMQSLRGY